MLLDDPITEKNQYYTLEVLPILPIITYVK